MRISSIAFSRGSVIAQAALSIGAVLQHHHNAHCFFGKGKAQLDAEERQRQLDLEIKTLREQLEDAQKTLSQMPAAMEVLDRNHDGKIDAKDLAMLEDDLRVVIGKKVTAAVETGVPSQMGFGFISGWCSGFTLRRVGKVMAFGCGSVFILLQSLAYNGFIKIDMDMIEKKSMSVLDRNQDGKVDEQDLNVAMDEVLQVLQFGMPSGGGFAAGFVAGLR